MPGTVLVKETQKHKKMADAEDHSLQDVSDNSFEIIVTKFHYISLKIQFIDENNRKEYVFKKFLVDGHILLEDDKDSNFTKTVALKNLKMQYIKKLDATLQVTNYIKEVFPFFIECALQCNTEEKLTRLNEILELHFIASTLSNPPPKKDEYNDFKEYLAAAKPAMESSQQKFFGTFQVPLKYVLGDKVELKRRANTAGADNTLLNLSLREFGVPSFKTFIVSIEPVGDESLSEAWLSTTKQSEDIIQAIVENKIQLVLVDGNNRFGLLEDAHLDTMISISAYSELDSQEKIALSCANSGKLDVSAKLNTWKDIVWKLSGYVSRMSDPKNTIQSVICEDLENLMKKRLKSEYGNHGQMLKALIFAFEHPQSFLEGLKYIATCEATGSYSVPISQCRFWDDLNPHCFSMAFKAATSMISVGKAVNVAVLQRLYRLGMVSNNHHVAMFVKLFFKTQEDKLPESIFKNDHENIKLLDNSPAKLVRKLGKLRLRGLNTGKAREIGLQPVMIARQLASLEDGIDQVKAIDFFIRYEFLLETPIDYDAFNEAAHVAVKEIWTKIDKYFEDKKTVSQESSNSDSGSEAKDANSVNQSQDTRDGGAAAATEKKRPGIGTTSARRGKRKKTSQASARRGKRRKTNVQFPIEPGVEQKFNRKQRAARRMQLQESREAKSAIIPAVVASGKLLVEEPAASSASEEEVEPNTQTGKGPVDAKAAASASEGETPIEFGDEADFIFQSATEGVIPFEFGTEPDYVSQKANAQSANSSATTPGEEKARDISSSSSSEVKYNIEAAAPLANVKADAKEQMKEGSVQAIAAASGTALVGAAAAASLTPFFEHAPVGAAAAASAPEEGKIPAKKAQTGKGPILPVGAAPAASSSFNSSAVGGADNEVIGNTL